MRTETLHIGRRLRAGALFLALLAACAFSVRAERETPPERQGTVLIIASYNPDTRRMSNFISEFEKGIDREKLPFDIVIEDMGCKSLSEAPLWRKQMGDIFRRYERADLRAVILLGQEAWATYLSCDRFPHDIPFFGGFVSRNGIRLPHEEIDVTRWTPPTVDMIALADSLGKGGGLLNEYDVGKNIRLIRSLYPDVENIAFVSANTYGGVSLQALVKTEMKKFPDLNLVLVDAREGEAQAAARISALPHNSVLLIGTWRVGQGGQYLLFGSIASLVANNAALPVFSLSGSGIGNVALGGYVPIYENGAAEIAAQIARHYRGKSDAVHFDLSPLQYTFDARKLREFGIAEYKLPNGSTVVDSMEAELEKYKTYISAGIIAFVVLVLLLAFIYYLYYRNNRLKNVLQNREAELIRAKENAEESDRLKSAFLANMSHEIRTPLNAIVGFSTLLGDDSLSAEERNEYNTIVSKNSEMLLTLISDILDISRLETGQVQFNYAEENIYDVCQQVLHTTSHNRKPGLECIFKPGRESYRMKTDAMRLSQILINLLTNANKFTETGSITLAFEVQEDQGRVLFSVADTGCGIPPEKQRKVFDRFEKLNEFKQGTGLGLAICRQIARMFGGDIWVDPDYTGGARFVFSHPILP